MRRFLKHFPFNKLFVSLFVILYTFAPSAQAMRVVAEDISTQIDTSEDILDEGISDPPEIANPNVSEEEVIPEVTEPLFSYVDGVYTVNKVVVNEEYVYPDNSNVRVKFTSISEEGNLVISKVLLTKEEKSLLNTSDDYGWDISSSMSNGSFKYDLTLPNSTESNDVEVKYSEDGNTYESIDNKLIVNENVIEIKGLEHFSIYVVSSTLPVKPSPAPVQVETEVSCDITVPTDGVSIQEAINKSGESGKRLTICVKEGVYERENLIIDHPVRLVALLDDPQTEKAVIIGEYKDNPTIYIMNTTNVEINGLTIVENSSEKGAILVEGSLECLFINNRFLNNGLGVYLIGSKNNRIEKNIFENNQKQITIEPLDNDMLLKTILQQNRFDGSIIVRSQTGSVSTIILTIFGTIKAAVNSANNNDILDIYYGTYNENVTINIPLTLRGVEERRPTIHGGFTVNTEGIVNIDHLYFEVPENNPVDSIHIGDVDRLYVKDSNFNGSGLFVSGSVRGIMSDDLNATVKVQNSNFENGYYTALQGKYAQLNVVDATISNCKSGINFQGGKNLVAENTDISVIAQGDDNDTYAVRFASSSAGSGYNMILDGGKYSVDKNGYNADSGIYHSAIIVRSGASGELKANNLSLNGDVINLSEKQLDARYNWWGDMSGPRHTTNLTGSGYSATGNVSLCPWLDAEDGQPFGPCIDYYNPVIESVTYFKNSSPITEQGTATDPVYVKSISELSYNASFSDGLKLGKHVFVIYDENPNNPGTPYWVGSGGKAYCSFNGTNNTFDLGGKNDSVSGISFENCTNEPLEDGRYVVVNRVYDAVGKFSESYNLTFVVDNTAPTADLVFPTPGYSSNYFNVVFNEAVNSIEAVDPANYFLNNWPEAGGSGNLTGDATIDYDSSNKIATVKFRNPGWYISPEQQWGVENIHDLAGNIITPNPYSETSTPMLPPITTDSGTDSNWHNTPVTVNLSCTDIGGSGCKKTYYTTDGSTPTTSSPSGNSIILSTDGIYTIKYFSVDNAGNKETVKTTSNTVKIDKTQPTITDLTINKTHVKAGDALTITANVTDSSGIVAVSADFSYTLGYEYTNRPAPISVTMTKTVEDTYSINYVVPPSWNEGTMYIKVAARDNTGGNWVRSSSDVQVVVDNTDPIIADHDDMTLTEGELFPTDILTLTDNYELNQVCATVTGVLGIFSDCIDINTTNYVGDQFSAASEVRKAIEVWKGMPEGSFTTINLSVLPEGTYHISYYATDKAENESDVQTFIATIQNNAPTITINPTDTELTEGDPAIVLTTTVTNGNPPFTYSWSGACTGMSAQTTFNPTTEGSHTCTVTVTDADEDTSTDSVDITVGAVAGVATENGNAEGASNSTTSSSKQPPAKTSKLPLGTGGYPLLSQADLLDTEEQQTPEEETITEDTTAIKGEEDINGEPTKEEVTPEEKTTKWWIYPLVILPLLAIFLILWKRRKEEDEPQL